MPLVNLFFAHFQQPGHVFNVFFVPIFVLLEMEIKAVNMLHLKGIIASLLLLGIWRHHLKTAELLIIAKLLLRLFYLLLVAFIFL